MSFKRLKARAGKSKIKVTRMVSYLVEWKEGGRGMDCICNNLHELDERIKDIERPKNTKKEKSKKLLKKMEPWLRNKEPCICPSYPFEPEEGEYSALCPVHKEKS